MSFLKNLNSSQKEAIGLLQIGTFLEYFDLMLYVHMAVLLNELFFPETDPHTASLVAAFAFCSTYVLRPFGAIVFGYIGDNIGRKATVVLTTMMMSLSCIAMATLPTYAQIGITASWVVTICRIVQGLSSMGEVMGAKIYITEITKPPIQYPAVLLVTLSSSMGAMFALGLATFVNRVSMNWRYGFWAGAAIAVVGSVARTRLRETPDFIDMKRKKQLQIEKNNLNKIAKKQQLEVVENQTSKSKFNKKDFLAYFLLECSNPLCFYLYYIYFNPLLKTLGYSASDIIFHNFILSIVDFFVVFPWIYLVAKIHPLKLLKFQSRCFLFLIVILPFFVIHTTSVWQIFFFQSLLFPFVLAGVGPAAPIFIKRFNVANRFTATTVGYALARSCMYIICAFGLVYLTEWLGYWGIWIISFPAIAAFFWSINYFTKMEGLLPDSLTSKAALELKHCSNQ